MDGKRAVCNPEITTNIIRDQEKKWMARKKSKSHKKRTEGRTETSSVKKTAANRKAIASAHWLATVPPLADDDEIMNVQVVITKKKTPPIVSTSEITVPRRITSKVGKKKKQPRHRYMYVTEIYNEITGKTRLDVTVDKHKSKYTTSSAPAYKEIGNIDEKKEIAVTMQDAATSPPPVHVMDHLIGGELDINQYPNTTFKVLSGNDDDNVLDDASGNFNDIDRNGATADSEYDMPLISDADICCADNPDIMTFDFASWCTDYDSTLLPEQICNTQELSNIDFDQFSEYLDLL